jgi:hypothetical protein
MADVDNFVNFLSVEYFNKVSVFFKQQLQGLTCYICHRERPFIVQDVCPIISPSRNKTGYRIWCPLVFFGNFFTFVAIEN